MNTAHVYRCTKWSHRLNRTVGNGWTNDLRGDLATNLPTEAAARKDYAERTARAEAERAAQAITDAAYAEAPGMLFVGMDAATIRSNPEMAKRTIRAAIMTAEGSEEAHLEIGLRYAKATGQQ